MAPRGDKSAYTTKQKRQARHIEESAREQGRSAKTAERIAWATVNKTDGGGKKTGSGRGADGEPASRRTATRAKTKKPAAKKTNKASGSSTSKRKASTSRKASASR